MANFPATSFMNLFKNIVYDKEQNANYSLDIWDAYVISPLLKNEAEFFVTHVVRIGDTWASLALQYYQNDRLWWVIPLFNDIEDPFLIFDNDLFLNEVQQLKVLRNQYIDQLLLLARQEKILNDRLIKEGRIDG
jgi:hypothetical protein